MNRIPSDKQVEIFAAELLSDPAVQAELKSTRERDWLWEAVMRECGVDTTTVTSFARGAYNRAVKAIRDVGGTPDEVRARASLYRRRFDFATLTPMALAKQWAQLVPPRESVQVPNQVARCPQCQKLSFDCVCP